MNSPAPLPDRFDQHASEQITADAARHIAGPLAEALGDGDSYDNPLWTVAFAQACLVALVVCLMLAG